MSILQSPRVKDGSQNLEVSAFVVDMTGKSRSFLMPVQSNLHDCHSCVLALFVSLGINKTPTENSILICIYVYFSFSHQQMAPHPQDISNLHAQHQRSQQQLARQERNLQPRLQLRLGAPHMLRLHRYKQEDIVGCAHVALMINTLLFYRTLIHQRFGWCLLRKCKKKKKV